MKSILRGLIVALFFVSTLHADDCDAILAHGIRDELEITSLENYKRFFEEIMKKSYKELKSKDQAGLGDAQVGYGNFIAAAGDTFSEKKFNEVKKSYKRNTKEFFESTDFKHIVSRTVNESVVKAWSDCKSDKKILCYYTGDLSDEFVVTVKYVRRDSNDPKFATIASITATSGIKAATNEDFKKSELKEGGKINEFAFVSQVFKRIDPKKPASLQIDFGGLGHVDLRLPRAPVPVAVAPGAQWTDWKKLNCPPVGKYNKQKEHTLKLTVPAGYVILPGSAQFKQYWKGWGSWVGAPKFSSDSRTMTRDYSHGKHDVGRTIAMRVQYVKAPPETPSR